MRENSQADASMALMKMPAASRSLPTFVVLPDSRGLATFLAIHAQFPSAPIIILAGFDNETLALEAVRQGAQDYLVKSKFEGRMLARVIRAPNAVDSPRKHYPALAGPIEMEADNSSLRLVAKRPSSSAILC
jgi:DNA-binding NarL/FixJ family response regulator